MIPKKAIEKVKCWVVYDEEYPGGMIYSDRDDALTSSRETRSCGLDAYTRVQYFTAEELAEFSEAD